jgi:hypothetical protein
MYIPFISLDFMLAMTAAIHTYSILNNQELSSQNECSHKPVCFPALRLLALQGKLCNIGELTVKLQNDCTLSPTHLPCKKFVSSQL